MRTAGRLAAAVAVTVLSGVSLVATDEIAPTPAGGRTPVTQATVKNDSVSATGVYQAPFADARRSSANTNDLRGKILCITVAADGSYTVPPGNLFAPGQTGTRPEIYAMGFRNPFRITLDRNDIAYITDYSPNSSTAAVGRGPAGTGRMMP